MIIGQPQQLDDNITIDGKEIPLEKAIEMADKQIEELKKSKTAHIHFLWNQKELDCCKRIAEKKGLKYQSYIKSILKQAMDAEEAG